MQSRRKLPINGTLSRHFLIQFNARGRKTPYFWCMENEVIHNQDKHRFEWHQDGLLSVVEYRWRDGIMAFTHTEVPPALEGQGIAAKLAKTALDYARDNEILVMPYCPYIKVYLERHPEYKSLVRTIE